MIPYLGLREQGLFRKSANPRVRPAEFVFDARERRGHILAKMIGMKAKPDTKNIERREDILNVLILISIASVLGVYLVAATVLISKDGVTYITLAGMFSSEPLNVIKGLTPGYPKGLAFGYPFLILAAHKVAAWFGADSSVIGWTYSAQSMTLLCRVLALIPLYFIGKLLVGARRSFWATAILIVLPDPAQLGSDALRDWPHILFLAAGLCFLLRGARDGKWWMFSGAGLAAGFGHIIRPECGQVLVYGAAWILMRLVTPEHNMKRRALAGAMAGLLLGFAIPAAPYMAARGQILPQKLKEYIGVSTLWESGENSYTETGNSNTATIESALGGKTIRAVGKLAGQISDNLMYYFVPALVIGAYARIRRRSALSDIEKFFIPAFVFLNVLMMIMLYSRWEYISRRHCLPLAVVLTFYVPEGMEILARWLDLKFSKDRMQDARPSQRWFFILLAIGVGICTPKLLSSPGYDKQGYGEAAEWLRRNSRPADVVAVPDLRISFYAERKGIVYTNEIPEGSDYVVRIVEEQDEQKPSGEFGREMFSVRVEKREKNKKRVVIYQAT